jgi:hypothetical protein
MLRVVTIAVVGALPTLASRGQLLELMDSPWLVEAPQPLPLLHLFSMLGDGLEGVAKWILLGLVLGLVLDQVVTAGAVRWLNSERRGLVAPFVIGEGTRSLWPMLRVALVSAVLGGTGAGALIAGGSALAGDGVLITPFVAAMLGMSWMAFIGAWAHQAQVIVAHDGRRRSRRAMVLALRVWRRHWLQGPLIYPVVAVIITVATAVVLVSWRGAEPRGDAWMWQAAWVNLLFVQAAAWHWMLRLGTLLYTAHPELAETPDEPFGLVGWVRAKLGR